MLDRIRSWLFGPPDIGRLRAKGNVLSVIAALRNADAKTQLDATVALGQMCAPERLGAKPHDDAAAQALVLLLLDRSSREDLRIAAIIALLSMQNSRAVGSLMAVRDDDTAPDHLREVATKGLDEVPQWLVPLLNHHFGDGRPTAAESLQQIGRAVVPHLLAALQDASRWKSYARRNIRERCALLLGKLGDQAAVGPLRSAALESPAVLGGAADSTVQRAAAEALRAIGGEEAERALAEYRSSSRRAPTEARPDAKADWHYLLSCRECGFTHNIPRDCNDPPAAFSVDADHVRIECVYGGVFTVTLTVGDFFTVAPVPASGAVLHASIAKNMKVLHGHIISHYDPVFLVIQQSPERTTHEYKKQQVGPTYVRFSKGGGVDVVGNIDASKAEIPGVSW